MYTLEQIQANMNSIDRQLLYMIYEQQAETNRLLRLITNENKQEVHSPSDEHKNAATDDIDSLKRQELMKRIAKLSNKPQGWNSWKTEDMRKHLKGAS